MATQILGRFSYWQLTQEEELNGQTLNQLQKQVLQNTRSQISDQLLNLDYDPINPVKFAQDEAFLRGQLAVVETLLDQSDASEKLLKQLASQSRGSENSLKGE